MVCGLVISAVDREEARKRAFGGAAIQQNADARAQNEAGIRCGTGGSAVQLPGAITASSTAASCDKT